MSARITSAIRIVSLALAATGLLVLTACGGQASPVASSSAEPSKAVSTRAVVPARAATPKLSYSGSVPTISTKRNYAFSVAFNVTLGQATTNTTNENPGYLNVVAPVSGTATLTNTTTDYTASEAEYPPLEVDALYPSNSPVCGHQGASVPHDGDVPVGHIGRPFSAVVPFYGGDLCTLRVAALHTTLTAACGGDSSEESLAGGQSINLMVEPDGSQGDGAGCDQPDDPGYLVLSGLFPAEAELTVAALRAPPKYWAVFSSDGDTSSCPRSALAAQKKAAGEYSEPPLLPVVTSEPSGLSGCVVGPR